MNPAIAHGHPEPYRPDCDACVAETNAYRQARTERRARRRRRRLTWPHLGGHLDTNGQEQT